MKGEAMKDSVKRAKMGPYFASFLADDGSKRFNFFKEAGAAEEWLRRNARDIVPGSASVWKVDPPKREDRR